MEWKIVLSDFSKSIMKNKEASKEAAVLIGNYPIITLCGSTKFKDAFMEQPQAEVKDRKTCRRLLTIRRRTPWFRLESQPRLLDKNALF